MMVKVHHGPPKMTDIEIRLKKLPYGKNVCFVCDSYTNEGYEITGGFKEYGKILMPKIFCFTCLNKVFNMEFKQLHLKQIIHKLVMDGQVETTSRYGIKDVEVYHRGRETPIVDKGL